jgi:HEPN domain-containing protein
MPLDPVLVADTKAWLTKAANDLRGADIDLAASPPLIEDALFHCQQAAEKAFKAFLTFHNRAFRKTHNLEEIGKACAEIDGTLKPLVDEAVPLTEFAWAFRYPGDPTPPQAAEAQAAFALAKKILEAVLSRIAPEAHP